MRHKKLISSVIILTAIVAVSIVGVWSLAPGIIEPKMNSVTPHASYLISDKAKTLHESLIIGDWHSDSVLWERDLASRSNRGHVDIPRLQQGNVALQMFTTVTKSPKGQNYQSNSSDAGDNITLLAMAQGWPLRTWNSLTERALYQAEKLHRLTKVHPNTAQLILNQKDLTQLLARRQQGEKTVGVLIGTEGSHALDGDLDNIQRLYDAGFRMMSLHHFFDNRLGGSLHGESGSGLSDFGQQAVDKMLQLGIMIDVSHSAAQVVEDLLARHQITLIVSHTGVYGHCASHRNFSDALMQKIATAGGIIGIGYWDGAVCDATPENIVRALRYAIDLVGADHVALGSDFDGSTETPFDTSELSVLTHFMLEANFSEKEIRQVMGENMASYLAKHLPKAQ
ncbi:MAG: peptidase M19 [Cellvibrionaceae bacterium]|nr:peptidase M19 [Cellvibrionaceae bacterium]